jgi:chromosome segregation ATPase
MQYVSGSPVNLSHLLWRPDEELALVTPGAGARVSLGNNDNAQNISQRSASDQSFAELEHTIRASDRPGSELPRERDGSSIRVKDSDKADMELLQAARRLRAEMELVTNELSTSEFQKQQAQNKCHTLERQATEQRSKEAELLANAQRLREEIMKTESEAAECQKDADRLDKEADDERNSRKERETIIAATKERATEIEKKLQKIRDELEI